MIDKQKCENEICNTSGFGFNQVTLSIEVAHNKKIESTKLLCPFCVCNLRKFLKHIFPTLIAYM